MTNLVVIAVISYWCSCARCTPRPIQPTAAGVAPARYRTVAAPRSVPLGTIVDIEGIGRRVVEDRTALRFDGRFDVYVGSDRAAHKRAKNLGIRMVKITFR